MQIRYIWAIIAVLALTGVAAGAEGFSDWTIMLPSGGSSYSLSSGGEGAVIAAGGDAYGPAIWTLDGGDGRVADILHTGGENATLILFLRERDDGSYILFTDTHDLTAAAADGEVLWTYHVPRGAVSSVALTPDGGVVLAGTFIHAFLTRISPSGEVVWDRVYSSEGAGGLYRFTSVRPAESGGFIVGGYLSPFLDGNTTGLLIRTDDEGNPVWQTPFGVHGAVASVSPAPGGSFYAALVGEGERETWLALIDGAGKIELVQEYGSIADSLYYLTTAADKTALLAGWKENEETDEKQYLVISAGEDCSLLWKEECGLYPLIALSPRDDGGYLCAFTDGSVSTRSPPPAATTPLSPLLSLIAIAIFACGCRRR